MSSSDVREPMSFREAPSAGLFTPVTSSRVSQVVVNQVRELVRSGRLGTGDKLPSERDMCDLFGVSRVTVREALRILETNGIVEIRVGAQGGAYITAPSRERVGESLADLMLLSPITAREVTEARMIFELGAIPLVVERATAEDLAGLRSLCEEARVALAEGSYTMTMSAAYHMRLASSTHNAAIEALVHSFYGLMVSSLREAQMIEPLMGHRGSEEHLELIDAIAIRDIDAVSAIMRRHLGRTADRVSLSDCPCAI